MANYYLVVIDETGSFEKKFEGKFKAKSRVGGAVFKFQGKHEKGKLKNAFDNILHEWNCKNPQSIINSLRGLHYGPLRGFHSGHKSSISINDGTKLTNKIVKKIGEMAEMCFCSSGFPPFFSNEQQAYTEILRATIYGIIASELQLTPNDTIEIAIGTRAKAGGKLSLWQPINSRLYHKILLEELKRDVAEIAKQKQVEVEFYSVSNGDYELIAADFVLGNLSVQKNKVDIHCRRIEFGRNYYKLISQEEPEETVRKAIENGDCPIIYGCLQLLHLYAQETENNKRANKIMFSLGNIIQNLNDNLYEEFIAQIDRTLKTLVIERNQHSSYLDNAQKYCEAILQICQNLKTTAKLHLVMRLKEVIMRHQISIESHKGTTDISHKASKLIKDYRSFFEENKQLVYESIGERIHKQIDMELKAIQVSHFNEYNFKEVEDLMTPHYNQYKKTYQSSFAAGEKDALFAKLCGTLAQAHAFVYDISQQEEDYEFAKMYFGDDIDHLPEQSRSWRQGVQYLIHLELSRKNMSDVIPLAKKLWDVPDSPSNFLSWLTQKSDALEGPYDYNLLLKTASYYHHLNPDITIDTTNLKTLLQMIETKNFSVYPLCNILKWCCYLAIKANKCNIAEKALALVPSFKEEEFTVKTLELPLILQKCFLQKQYSVEISQKLQEFTSQSKYFAEYLQETNWQTKFSKDNIQNWNLWHIATSLPFYFH